MVRQALRIRVLSVTFSGLLCLAAACPLTGCDERTSAGGGNLLTGQPQILVDPQRADFGAVQVDTLDRVVFSIANMGSAVLELKSVSIQPLEPTDTRAFTITRGPDLTKLAADARTEVEVTFAPTAPGDYAALLVIECNDPGVDGRVEIPLQSLRIEGDIFADPQLVDFGSVQPDQERVLHTDLVNAGAAAFDITELRLVNAREPNDFRIVGLGLCTTRQLPPDLEASPGGEPSELEADCAQASGIITVEPGRRLRVKVLYRPTGGNVDEARIVATTNLPRRSSYEIAVLGSEPTPRLLVEPEVLEFGPTPVEGKTLELSLRNAGTGELVLEGISMAVSVRPEFVIEDAPPRGDVILGEVAFCGRCECRCTNPTGGEELAVLENVQQMACLRETDCEAECSKSEERHAAEAGAPAVCAAQEVRRDERRVRVSFHPQCSASGYLPSSSMLYIKSNDQLTPPGGLPVELTGRLDAAGIDVRPTALDFRTVASGEERTLSFRVYNIGSQPLELTRLEVSSSSPGGEFTLTPQGDIRAIPGGENVEVQVTYRPSGEHASSGEITIEHGAPCGGPVKVALSGRGGGAPYCSVIVSPRQINYGTVAAGRAMPKLAQIRSIGTGSCKFVSARLVAAMPFMGQPNPAQPAPAVFRITDQPPQVIPALEAPVVEVTYTPVLTFTNTDEAFLLITTSDPDGRNPVESPVHLLGATGKSEIQVLPTDLDFGLTTLGCASQTLAVTVYNVGAVNLTIDSIVIEPPSPEFEIVALPNLPAVVNRAVPAQVEVRYVPQDPGVDAADLVFRSDAQNGEYRVPMRGEGTLDDESVDEFVQAEGAKVDVLFVIDDSASMSDDQDNLARNFEHFVQAADLLNGNMDFHIGITTTALGGGDNPFAPGAEMGPDRGKLQGEPRFLTQDTPGFQQLFEDHAHVGDDDSGAQESGLEAARDALDPIWLSEVSSGACATTADCPDGQECVNRECLGYNRGFLREDASLELVFVSDEEDQSPSQVAFYVDFYKSLKGFRNEGMLRAWAIVGDSPNGCQTNDGSADAGKRYIEVAQTLGGRFHSICDREFSQAMADIGHTAFALRVQFFLSRVADPDSVVVEIDGRAVPSHANGVLAWEFDPNSNSVTFIDEASLPQPGQRITIRYRARCFPI